MNEHPLESPDIDLYALHLLRLVARFRGFTAASEEAGISQSALTRQVQGIEARLGIQVFERTTRSVRITEAGAVLLRETEAIPNILHGALRRVREDCLGALRQIHVGISRELALAHIPGLFPSRGDPRSEVRIIVSQADEAAVLEQVSAARVDLGILTLPDKLPELVCVTHRMKDRFVAITGTDVDSPEIDGSPAAFRKWAAGQNWLLPLPSSRSRVLIDDWARKLKLDLRPAMELESFDLMIQLASTGMGSALVPRRALSAFPRKSRLKKLQLPKELVRELVVVSPRHSRCPEHVATFVDGILFS